jgi:hypothetical protein
MSTKIAAALFCWCALSGCRTVVTVNPVVTDSTSIADPRMLGTWVSSTDTASAVVTQQAPRQYLVYSLDSDEAVLYHGRLGRLGNHLVLDLTTREGLHDLMIPGHVMLVLEFGDRRVRLLYPQPDSLKRYLERGDLALPYTEVAKGDIVITATTEQLRTALTGYLDRPGVLDTIATLFRPRPPEQ